MSFEIAATFGILGRSTSTTALLLVPAVHVNQNPGAGRRLFPWAVRQTSTGGQVPLAAEVPAGTYGVPRPWSAHPKPVQEQAGVYLTKPVAADGSAKPVDRDGSSQPSLVEYNNPDRPRGHFHGDRSGRFFPLLFDLTLGSTTSPYLVLQPLYSTTPYTTTIASENNHLLFGSSFIRPTSLLPYGASTGNKHEARETSRARGRRHLGSTPV